MHGLLRGALCQTCAHASEVLAWRCTSVPCAYELLRMGEKGKTKANEKPRAREQAHGLCWGLGRARRGARDKGDQETVLQAVKQPAGKLAVMKTQSLERVRPSACREQAGGRLVSSRYLKPNHKELYTSVSAF